jgi:hypothetical protein
MRISSFLSVILAIMLVGPTFAADEVSFARDIRPLLSDRCFKCHGFDEETKEADLGLHNFDEATRDLGGYHAILPGNPDASEVIARLIAEDPDDVMPPPAANKPRFSDEEVELMRRWIDQGAKYETHWAFEKPKMPEVPPGDAEHPIDRFLDARVEASDLEVNERADPYTLIRRLSIDLDWMGRALPRFSGLRRTVGTRLAGPRPLRRHEWIREGPSSVDLALSGLGHQCAQRGHAVRPVHDRAIGR